MDAINAWMILPFGILLGMIALAPLCCPDWWGKHYAKVACGLAVPTLGYYLIGRHAAVQVGHTAHEYLSFIALIGSLYIVAGGIHINVPGHATPLANTVFLLIGGILANVLGTTGASMLLIRPWLRMNQSRVQAHHVVFFIFIVSNVGGCLTPIGDPPLFLGYLMGIPFWWVAEHCLPMWVVAMGILLLMFFALDQRKYLSARISPVKTLSEEDNQWQFDGLANLFFLAVILGAVFINHPLFVREALMIAAAWGSYFTTRKSIHQANRFNFHPIQEVAILFIGIFATMMPALDWLAGNAGHLANVSLSFFYWSSGGLSSALDNAPTYLCFLKAISSHFIDAATVAQVRELIQNHGTNVSSAINAHTEMVNQTFLALQKYHATALANGAITNDEIETAFLLGNLKLNGYILAISIGSVFFGANTYIANGPNFMVKAIADQQQVPTPGFITYIGKYTIPCMLPTLVIVWWIFFR